MLVSVQGCGKPQVRADQLGHRVGIQLHRSERTPPTSPLTKQRKMQRFQSRKFSSMQSLSHVQLFVTPWTTAHQASLSITNSWSSPQLMSIELVMPSNHLILCRPLLLLPSIFPSIRVFSIESALRIRWPKYWSFSFNINPSNEHSGLVFFRMDWLDLLSGRPGAKKSAWGKKIEQNHQ